MKEHFLFACIWAAVISSGWSKAPLITTPRPVEFIKYSTHPEDLVVRRGNNFHLRCEHTAHVNWSIPSFKWSSDKQVEWAVNLSGWYNNNTNVHVALLEVINPTGTETGFIYCKTDNAASDNDVDNVASVYVYIRDPVHIFIGDEESNTFLYPLENEPMVIACRPTSPDVDVELTLEGGDMTVLSNDSRFDPHVGFTLQNVDTDLDGNFECKGRRLQDNVEQTVMGIIRVMLKREDVEKPVINSTIFQVGTGGSITLQCVIFLDLDVFFRLYWILPDSVVQGGADRITNHSTVVVNEVYPGGISKRVGSVAVSVDRLKPSDSGTYRCVVEDHAKNTAFADKNVTIFSDDTRFINLTEQESVEDKAGSTVQWVVPYSAHPAVNLSWWFRGKPVLHERKLVVTTAIETKLKLINIRQTDAGVYRLVASNAFMNATMDLNLTVLAKPEIVRIFPKGELYYTYMKTYNISCEVTGYPTPNVSWFFRRCHNPPPDCSRESQPIHSSIFASSSLVSSHVRTAKLSGYLTCRADNTEGSANETMPLWVTDVKDGFDMKAVHPSTLPARFYAGDNITLECGVSIYNYTNNISWGFQSTSRLSHNLDNETNVIEHTSTPFSYKSSLNVHNVSVNQSGTYSCFVIDNLSFKQSKTINITVKEPKAPVMKSTNMKAAEVSVKTGSEVNFTCLAEGEPRPTVTWYKDNILVDATSKTIRFLEDNKTIIITAAIEEGDYSCRVANRVGSIGESIKLTILDKPTNTAYIIIGLVSFVLLILLIVLAKKIIQERQLQKEVRRIGLDHFENGALDSINPDLPIDDQAELLPYDRKWEFPSDKLKLGKQLGAGAFGVVMKADAIGIMDDEAVSTVAVKMVKRNADATYIKALASELKIMVHLGKHLNVVNLLGACTKNLNKRELFVIVEYCRYGNLHNYLLRHREDFIDQVDPSTGKIDSSVGADIIARHESITAKTRLKYSALSLSRSRADSEMSVEFRPNVSSSDSNDLHSGAALISMTPVGGSGEEGMLLSNNSIQPEWRSNYGGDYKGNVRPISTRDLLCWAFQVARGMDYLAGRKVLHGDLAARNILLSDDNIVKICDFGLAKSMYKSDNYRKKGDGPLPIKWMAIESIRDRVFSTQSDVWSFGIVLWELFSLARTPYPGMEADEKLYNKLVEGYRMDKPEYATEEIQHVMDRCWKSQPCSRPSFTELSEYLGNMLEDSVRMHYIDLNDPYISMNTQWRTEQKSDYLAMVTAPTYDNMVAPAMDDVDLGHHYVNGSVTAGPSSEAEAPPEASGYLLMKPSSVIFSPRSLDLANSMFNFSEKRQSQGDSCSNRESRPLTASDQYQLPSVRPQRVNDLNKDSNLGFDENMDTGDVKESRPNFAPSFSNPSYRSLQPILSVAPDNYVNMPQKVPGQANDFDSETVEDYVNIPKHGYSLSNTSSGFQSDTGERSRLNSD